MLLDYMNVFFFVLVSFLFISYLGFGQAQPKISAYLITTQTNIKDPSYDGGLVYTDGGSTLYGKYFVSND